jgi:type I restriction enzyme M protein
MTQGELESYLDKAADILRGNADHSEFRGYVFALLFYKRISDCFDEEVRTQVADALTKAGVPQDQALLLARDPQNHHFTCPKRPWATWRARPRPSSARH